MSPRSTGQRYEEQVLARLRLDRSFKRCDTRIGNRAWRQSRIAVRVIRMRAVEIGAVDRAAISAAEERCIDHCRIAVELHAEAQTIREYSRHLRALFRDAGLFL